jgi:hypothetical protein
MSGWPAFPPFPDGSLPMVLTVHSREVHYAVVVPGSFLAVPVGPDLGSRHSANETPNVYSPHGNEPMPPTWLLRLSPTQSPLPPRLASPAQLRLQPHLVLSRIRPRPVLSRLPRRLENPAQLRLPPSLVHSMIPTLSTQTRFSPRTAHPWTGILPSKPHFRHRPAPSRPLPRLGSPGLPPSPAQSSLQTALPIRSVSSARSQFASTGTTLLAT